MPSALRQQQIAEAEQLLGGGPAVAGPVRGLFFGRYDHDRWADYPDFAAARKTGQMVEQLRAFCTQHIDPVKIDAEARIPDDVVKGLGELGVLGACLPASAGGGGRSQTDYCRMIEVLGGHCASTALFVNAHHSIGPRAVVLFGTPEQQETWLPKMATGEWISAFALTEPEAGSDAANVQTIATPTDDGSGYRINGEKRWITNGGIAQVLTVMARTPVPGESDTKITAFLVTPDMPGFEVVEARMEKCGVRGTATARLAFHDMFVPTENVLGELGKGLKVALTVLDYGRTTFGASCTGTAKTCLRLAAGHASSRRQFGQTLGSFEMVKQKLADMAADTYAMEAATYQTAALIDSGAEDYMLETAILKVFTTDRLWRIVNDAFQIYGGKAYFNDEPLERMMRDARINMIGEGANDVLRAFIALVGMRDVGLELQGIADALLRPVGNLGRLGGFAARHIGGLFSSPVVPVRYPELERDAAALAGLVARFGRAVERLLAKYREEIVDRQYQLGRVADAAIELYTSACVLNRLNRREPESNHSPADRQSEIHTGHVYLTAAARRIRGHLAALWDNDDELTTGLADELLATAAER